MFTPEEISKMPRRDITAKAFIKLAEITHEGTKELIKQFDNGDFLAVWLNQKNNIWYRLHLKSMWFKTFTLNYSCHKDIKKGDELLISNMSLPKGPVAIRK